MIKPLSPGAATWPRDLLSSIVVFLVALPLCMGIAVASNVPVSAGLVSGIIAGLVVGSISGCPLQVSGPTAGLTLVVYDTVQTYGLETLGAVAVLAGLMQFAAGTIRIGNWFRAVSPAVVNGLMAGIGVLIFASQFHVMLDDLPKRTGLQNLITIPQAMIDAFKMPESGSHERWQRRRELLQQLGEVHRKQVQLNEQIAERLPHDKSNPRLLLDVILEDFVPLQREIQQELDLIVAESVDIFASEPARQEKASKLGAAAQSALGVSAADLAENRGEIIAATQTEALSALVSLQSAYKHHQFAAAIGCLTILILGAWKAFAPKTLKIVPASLVAILTAVAVARIWQVPVLYVEVPDSIFEELHLLNPSLMQNVFSAGILLSALIIALTSTAETMLSAAAVDQLQTGPRTNYDKELCAVGIGNILCGMLGALPLSGVVVRSGTNVQSGAQTRLSTILHGLWLLIFVVALGTLLRMIPTSALAAILVYTGLQLVDSKAVRTLASYGRGEVVVYLVTVIMIVLYGLIAGVLTGLVVAVLRLVLRYTQLRIQVDQPIAANGKYTLRLNGVATFLRLPKLARALECLPHGQTVALDMRRLRDVDQACIELLESWVSQYQARGGHVEINWDDLKKLKTEDQQDVGLTHVA